MPTSDQMHQDIPTDTRPASVLAGLWGSTDRQLYQQWLELRDAWLAVPKGKSSRPSPATVDAYRRASMLWLNWLTGFSLYPWEVQTTHCRGWVAWLRASGASEATVAQRVAAVSSWYTYVINAKRYIQDAERCLFEDGRGAARENPFLVNNFQRPHVNPFDKAHLLTLDDLNTLFAYLTKRSTSVSGSRNYALILAHATTGARSSEICRLAWGDISRNWDQPGAYVYRWSGKGDKRDTAALPAPVHDAIVAHLKLAGRHDTIQRGDFIFPPLRTEQLRRLANTRRDVDYSRRHLTSSSVQRIFKTALRHAGLDTCHRIHDLRHTLAVLIERNGGDVHYIKNLLHHSSLAVTEIYLRDIKRRMVQDRHTAQILDQIGVNVAGKEGRAQ